jgi:hypothetical protein
MLVNLKNTVIHLFVASVLLRPSLSFVLAPEVLLVSRQAAGIQLKKVYLTFTCSERASWSNVTSSFNWLWVLLAPVSLITLNKKMLHTVPEIGRLFISCSRLQYLWYFYFPFI